MNYTPDELTLLAKCGWMEARQDGAEGMAAVMNVVINRVAASGFPKTVTAVIEEPNAFSWTRPSDPEYGLDPAKSTGKDFQMWQVAQSEADAICVLSGNLYKFYDATLGAHFYENPKNISADSWFARHILGDPVNHPFTVTIGEHNFYV